MLEILKIRKAEERDVESIRLVLERYALERLLLPRSSKNIFENISSFLIADIKGTFAGCVAIRDFNSGLYEIRSLAVPPEFTGHGIGLKLVRSTVELLEKKGKCRIFALTLRPKLFLKLGFKLVSKDLFPEKIWSDCAVCPKKEHCDEDAVLMEVN